MFGKAGFGKCGEGRRGGREGPWEWEIVIHVHRDEVAGKGVGSEGFALELKEDLHDFGVVESGWICAV